MRLATWFVKRLVETIVSQALATVSTIVRQKAVTGLIFEYEVFWRSTVA